MGIKISRKGTGNDIEVAGGDVYIGGKKVDADEAAKQGVHVGEGGRIDVIEGSVGDIVM